MDKSILSHVGLGAKQSREMAGAKRLGALVIQGCQSQLSKISREIMKETCQDDEGNEKKCARKKQGLRRRLMSSWLNIRGGGVWKDIEDVVKLTASLSLLGL